MQKKPKITLSKEDYLSLARLIDSMPEDFIIEQLAEEIERADIVAAEKLPTNVVAMGKKVTFTVESTEKTFTYQLVYPTELDDTNTKLSVLSPVGSAIIGLDEGSSIDWDISRKQKTSIRIDRVHP